MEEDEKENFIIEKIQLAGEIVNEPLLEKTVKEISQDSKYRKITIAPYFCECGKPITKENAARCSHCHKLICRDCLSKFEYSGKVHCRSCLKKYHDLALTKQEYLVLLCVSNEVRNANEIFKLTGINPSEVRKIIHSFIGRYLTKKKACFRENFFPKLRLTDHGNEALQVFERVYGKDEDSRRVKMKILEFNLTRK